MHLQYFEIDTAEINEMATKPLPHRQRNYHEIMWLTNGTSNFIIDGDHFKVTASAFFIFPQGRIHQFLPNKHVEGQVIRFSEDIIDDFPRLLFSKFNQLSKIEIDKLEIKQFKLLFELFKNEIGVTANPTPVITNLLKTIIYKLDEIKKKQFPSTSSQVIAIDIFDRFQLLLDTHITEHQPIQFYADKLNITPRKLGDVVKQVMNKSTTIVISERLLIEAKRGLLYSKKTITELSYKLGFEDNSYFTKFFKKQVKVTPKQFRLNNNLAK